MQALFRVYANTRFSFEKEKNANTYSKAKDNKRF